MRLRWFPDGDMLTIVRDDFVNLQESPAVFIALNSPEAQMLQHPEGGVVYIADETVYDWCYQLGRDAGGVMADGWVRVEDGLPDEVRDLWLYSAAGLRWLGYMHRGVFWQVGGTRNERVFCVTHWRYADVPEPPQEEGA